MSKFCLFLLISVFSSPIFAYDEVLMSCKLVSSARKGSDKIEIPNSTLTVSIRSANGNLAAILSGSDNPLSNQTIFGFNTETQKFMFLGKNLSNDKQYSLSQNVMDKVTGEQKFQSIEISRVSGNISIINSIISTGMIVSGNGNCAKLDAKPKF